MALRYAVSRQTSSLPRIFGKSLLYHKPLRRLVQCIFQRVIFFIDWSRFRKRPEKDEKIFILLIWRYSLAWKFPTIELSLWYIKRTCFFFRLNISLTFQIIEKIWLKTHNPWGICINFPFLNCHTHFSPMYQLSYHIQIVLCEREKSGRSFQWVGIYELLGSVEADLSAHRLRYTIQLFIHIDAESSFGL